MKTLKQNLQQFKNVEVLNRQMLQTIVGGLIIPAEGKKCEDFDCLKSACPTGCKCDKQSEARVCYK